MGLNLFGGYAIRRWGLNVLLFIFCQRDLGGVLNCTINYFFFGGIPQILVGASAGVFGSSSGAMFEPDAQFFLIIPS